MEGVYKCLEDSIFWCFLPFFPIKYLWQEYTNVLSNLLEGSASLHPLTVSIQEFAAAANEAHKEAKVRYEVLCSMVSRKSVSYSVVTSFMNFIQGNKICN